MRIDSRGCIESFTVSRFRNKSDNEPAGDVWSITKLATALTTFRERESKDGPLWSPTRFDGARNKEKAIEVCALVLDFDQGHDWEDFRQAWQGYAYALHTSHSHTVGYPKWRAVFPFVVPAPADLDHEAWWKALHTIYCDELGFGVVDPLKDSARMYYLPAHAPGAEHFSDWHDGELLDWRDRSDAANKAVKAELVAAEAEAAGRAKGISPGSGGAGNPGDDFNAKATWEEILEPKGWFKVGRRYGRMDLWQRPGQPKDDHCARTGVGHVGDRFVNWSTDPNVSMLPPNRAFDKFGVYARLYHDGDFNKATRELSIQGYGGAPLGIPAGNPPGFPPPPPKEDPGKGKAEAPATVEEQLELVENEEGDLEAEDLDAASGDYLPWTDLGNARRLIRRYPGQLRYCSDWGRWLTWDASFWREDAPENPGVRGLAHAMADALYERKKTRDLGKKLQGGSRITAMLREAQALPGVNVRYDHLDTHEMLLACRNGVINLQTGDLLAPDPDLLITKRVDLEYDPSAECPRFEEFLLGIMKERPELVDLLIRALGYSLTGSTKEQKFFLLYGPRGRNGKSTLMDLMQDLLGDGLAYVVRKKLLTDSDADSARFSKALIEGKRFVYADETRKGARLDIEFLKEFVGGKRMEAERKGKDGYQFKVQAKLWYAVNTLPGADFDASFKDRVVPIPFEQSYYAEDSENYQEGDLPPDKDLDQKLRNELPGILALLVQGCLRWQRMGGLGQPEQVKELKKQYETENDFVAMWIAERCHLTPLGRTKATELFQNFRDYAKTIGIRGVGRIGDFNARLEKEAGIAQIKPGNASWFTGIELRTGQGSLEEA